ncbi:TPA: hypothetical protein HA361_00895 [Candidatus Woesearchaeota archaeon]|nr:hypothetical protein [Candidatus Woesearchaeota archaeon]HII69203.1 hypothetical protein [Candidatus Woesearchaeota archaeon]
MSPEEQLIEQKAKLRMLELKMGVLIGQLEKEGVITKDLIEEQLNEALMDEKSNNG